MGHISAQAAERLVKDGLVEGIKLVDGKGSRGDCQSYAYAKMARKRIKKEWEEPRAGKFRDKVHSDLWGLLK